MLLHPNAYHLALRLCSCLLRAIPWQGIIINRYCGAIPAQLSVCYASDCSVADCNPQWLPHTFWLCELFVMLHHSLLAVDIPHHLLKWQRLIAERTLAWLVDIALSTAAFLHFAHTRACSFEKLIWFFWRILQIIQCEHLAEGLLLSQLDPTRDPILHDGSAPGGAVKGFSMKITANLYLFWLCVDLHYVIYIKWFLLFPNSLFPSVLSSLCRIPCITSIPDSP